MRTKTGQVGLASALDARFKDLLHYGVFWDHRARDLEQALICLGSDPVVQSRVPGLGSLVAEVESARDGSDSEHRELAFIRLYQALHGAGADYDQKESERFRVRDGISCLPGGLLPLFLSDLLLDHRGVAADLGCGNGLQGLLLQCLSPHKKTVQIELSGALIATGRLYQEVLGLPQGRIEWRHTDIVDTGLKGVDLVYMYRPVQPIGQGLEVYQEISRKLSKLFPPVIVVSLADCLNDFLGQDFSTTYQNEFLTVFSAAGQAPPVE